MVSQSTFVIGVIVCTFAWFLYFTQNDLVDQRRQQFVLALVAGWASMLLMEGFGLIGPYAGPEPHM